MSATRDEVPGGSARSPVRSWGRIERDHVRITRILADLEETPELERALELLRELAGFMPQHFAAEEGQDGLFDELLAIRPAVDSRLKLLCREHREIVEALEALEVLMLEAQKGLAQVGEAKADFVRKIREHERKESHTVMNVYLTDEGGG
jgi:hemerythrin